MTKIHPALAEHAMRDNAKLQARIAELEGQLAALSRQAEPTDTFTAVDMATAAAQGFRDGQQRVCIAEMEKANQLREEVEALRVALHGIASVNPAERGIEWAKSYASDGLKGAGSELYARWLETFKEAEALRALLNKALPVVEAHAGASHMLDGFRPARNKWDDLVDGIRAAMAAKDRP